MSEITVSRLVIYPIKSCQGVSVHSVDVGECGLVGDREYMLIEPDSTFVGQKRNPKLATVSVVREGRFWMISSPLMSRTAVIDTTAIHTVELMVEVQETHALVLDMSDAPVSAWFSELLGREVYMVKRHPTQHLDGRDRTRRTKSKLGEAKMAFQDGSPILICSETSLAELNDTFTGLIGMDRFRPNVVLRGLEQPWIEDRMSLLTMGQSGTLLSLLGMRKCQRCAVVETDQQTGVREPGVLKALAQIRPDKRPNFAICRLAAVVHASTYVQYVSARSSQRIDISSCF